MFWILFLYWICRAFILHIFVVVSLFSDFSFFLFIPISNSFSTHSKLSFSPIVNVECWTHNTCIKLQVSDTSANHDIIFRFFLYPSVFSWFKLLITFLPFYIHRICLICMYVSPLFHLFGNLILNMQVMFKYFWTGSIIIGYVEFYKD